MLKRLPIGFAVAAMAALAAGAGAAGDPPGSSDLVVHEWGTFTSIAGEDGRAVPWQPLDGPGDLPCFVKRTYPASPKAGLSARVRMETPVLYFYTPRETTVDVQVGFRQGLITEHYPPAAVTPSTDIAPYPAESGLVGSATWRSVRILPEGSTDFPRKSEPSHYYAARATDASPIAVGHDTERFLFYRGLGDFDLPVTATVTTDDAVIVSATRGRRPTALLRFDNRGGRIGYSVADEGDGTVTLSRPTLTSRLHDVTASLEPMLEAYGLYPREAHAMIETWRDSWFTEGSRIFYIVPRATVDAVLPIRITPAPETIVRVFVGRLELATGTTLSDVSGALAVGDTRLLHAYGRFLPVFANRAIARTANGAEAARLRSVLGTLAPPQAAQSAACR